MLEDFSLLSSWQQGRAEAGDALVRRHLPGVYRFFATKVPTSAEDLTQRTFLKCVEVKHRVRPELGFKGYLFGIARKVLYDHLRQVHRRPNPESFDAEISSSELAAESGRASSTLEALVVGHEREHLILAAMRKVPLCFQTALELFYWEHMSIQEIALALEVAQGTVKSRLARGRGLLAACIRQMHERGEIRDGTLRDLAGWTRSLGRLLA